jgi:hypothetical protein
MSKSCSEHSSLFLLRRNMLLLAQAVSKITGFTGFN